jgi:hypothetical protein
MKKHLPLAAMLACFCSLKVAAQAPNLPTKATLSQTILSSRTFSNATQTDTVAKYRPVPGAYTLEVIGKVNSATGRGLDIDTRNAKGMGIRLSLDASSLKSTSSLSSVTPLSASQTGTDQTIRIAVRNDSAHIYHNGAYIQSQPLSTINDIVAGIESAGSQSAVPGPNLIPGWAGTSGNYTGKPSDYGWTLTGTTSTSVFGAANSASGSRYVDVNATSNVHTYNGTTYNGRVLYMRWDAPDLANAVYTYPVTLEANTTYNFSMLHAYVSNATGAKTITVGIGKTTASADRYASHVFNTSGNVDLKRENFAFTSQEAGTYYLTFTGPWGLFSIAELSLNKNTASSLIPNWAGIAPNNAGSPASYSWAYTGTTVTTLFNTANGSSGVRYSDVNASSGANVHTYNGSTYTGRVLYIRWDGSTTSGTVYSYPVMLEANTTYNFSMLHAYLSNATGGKTMTVGIGKTTALTGRYTSHLFVTSGTRVLNREAFGFTSQEAGLYYLTFTGDWALFSIAELQLTKADIAPRFIFGKDYPSGAVDMSITSVTYDDGAYAPAVVASGPKQDVIVTGATASYLPAFNTNFIVPGKTDMHLTGEASPLVNSSVQLNSDDSWLFFDNIKPSVVIANWLSLVTINGTPAANNSNVRVSIYKNGTVVIPNGNVTSTHALQVYTGTNLSGATTSYEITTYHDSLKTFNNAIRSFKLKRGYMATFANNRDGSGYSRVFIANDADLVVNTMPQGLDATASFIRVLKWDWVSKKGKAGWSPAQVGATWYYDWNIGGAESADYNYSIIRQNGGWPAWTDIQNKQNVNHVLGFNEPDQANQSNLTVNQAVQQWPEIMKSGLRVGSPAPANPESSWITNFLAKTDSLNLRVDFVAIHCYWGGQTPQQWYSRLKSIYNRVKRPLWITEWNNGANWTGESWPADAAQAQQKQLNDMKGILSVLDTASFVERYAEYDWVEDKRALVLADTLTPAGKYYYANKSALAYNTATAAVHNWQLASPIIYSAINSDNFYRVTLNWLDLNGELGSKYVLERLIVGVDTGFTTVHEFTGYAYGSKLTYVDSVYAKARYRVKAFNLAGTQTVYSPVLTLTGDAASVAPASLTGTVVSARIVNLSWTAGTNARSYSVKRSPSADGPFTTIYANTANLTYRDTTLAPGTTYYYTVTSVNSSGESPNSTVLQLRTKDLVAPTAVINPHIASGDKKITLTWNLLYDANYEISRSATADGPYTVITSNVNALRYEDMNTNNGTTYYYKIVAFNSAGRSAETAVLSGTPVLSHHLHIGFNENTGTFTEDDWGGYNGTVVNAATWAAGKDGPVGALNLTSATSSYLQLANSPVSTLNDFTIAAWVKLPTTLATNTRLFDFGTGTANFMILIPKSGTNVRYKITCAAGTNDRLMPYVLPLDQWVHVAITQQGTTFKFYVNGVQQYTDNNATVKPADLGLTTNNYLGKSQYSTDPYSGHTYDDFRIYNRGLRDTEIAALLKNDQTITFGTIAAQQVGDADFDPMATASSGLAVNYSSSDTTVATIVNGKVHMLSGGTSTISATQTGNTLFNAAPTVSQVLTVNKLSQAITFTAFPPKNANDTNFATGASTSSGLPLSYVSSDSTVAIVVNDTVRITGAGTTAITASQNGSTWYLPAAPVTQNLVVSKLAQVLTFNPLPVKKLGDADVSVIATVNTSLPLTYASSNSNVAVFANGRLHITGVGNTSITVSQAGNGTYESATATQIFTVIPLNLQVQYLDGDNRQPGNNVIRPYIRIVNQDTVAVAYNELTVRYWFTAENYSGINTWIDYAQLGNSNVSMAYIAVPEPKSGATGYIEYRILSSGNMAANSNTGPIQSRLANQDWANLNEADDYSYQNSTGNYTANPHITLYRNGALIWGTEPAPATPLTALSVSYQNQNQTSGGNTISTYLTINNTGNVPVAYGDVTVRYWFIEDGSQSMNYWIDYAVKGNNNISGKVVTLNTGLTGADHYFETAVKATAGTLYPLSNSGNIQYRIAKADWSIFNEANDYSYAAKDVMKENNRITAYYKGVLIYGTEPAVLSINSLAVNTTGQAAKLPPPVDIDKPLSDKLIIYPNPLVDTRFSVKLTRDLLNQQISVKIRNAFGKIMQADTFKADGDALQVSLSGSYAPGVYFVQLNTLTPIGIWVGH